MRVVTVKTGGMPGHHDRFGLGLVHTVVSYLALKWIDACGCKLRWVEFMHSDTASSSIVLARLAAFRQVFPVCGVARRQSAASAVH